LLVVDWLVCLSGVDGCSRNLKEGRALGQGTID